VRLSDCLKVKKCELIINDHKLGAPHVITMQSSAGQGISSNKMTNQKSAQELCVTVVLGMADIAFLIVRFRAAGQGPAVVAASQGPDTAG
jgi:hypothetical protein